MTKTYRCLLSVLVVTAALASSACVEDGIGMGVPTTGARWGGGATGPDVLVAGSPAIR